MDRSVPGEVVLSSMCITKRFLGRGPVAALVVAVLIAACNKEEAAAEPAPTSTPDPRSPFLGNWNVTDSLWIDGALAEVRTYVLPITTGGTAADTLFFNNLWNDGAPYRALMSGDAFSFPSQQVSGPYYMSGNGIRNGTQLFYQTAGDLFVHRGHGLKQ